MLVQSGHEFQKTQNATVVHSEHRLLEEFWRSMAM